MSRNHGVCESFIIQESEYRWYIWIVSILLKYKDTKNKWEELRDMQERREGDTEGIGVLKIG
jgi:hypothetical protein